MIYEGVLSTQSTRRCAHFHPAVQKKARTCCENESDKSHGRAKFVREHMQSLWWYNNHLWS